MSISSVTSLDTYTCFYCKCKLVDIPTGEARKKGAGGYRCKNARTIDHKIPRTRGGTNAPENLVEACISCNARKNNRTCEEYIEWLKSH